VTAVSCTGAHAHRGDLLLQVAGLIDHQHRFLIVQLPGVEAAEIVTEHGGIPLRPRQQMLQAVRGRTVLR
jgi:hypothetical protein